jgi:uncharacterized protein
MIEYIQKGLGKLVRFQQKNFFLVLLIIVLLFILAGVGITKTTFESDLSKLNPDDLPVTELDLKISKEFNDLSSVVVILELDENSKLSNNIKDIRSPEVIEFLVRLDDNLKEEISVQEVFSLGTIFSQIGVPPDLESIKGILDDIPESNQLLNNGYSLTMVFVEVDIGGDSSKINAVSNEIRQIVEESSPPGGVNIVVTGDAPLTAIIFDFIIKDAMVTMIIAFAFIFALLLIMQRSLKEAVIILIPLVVGLTWTLGILGWLNIPITIGTAGLSAMLLGLGVEYGIFLFSRFKEENQKAKVNDALEIAVSNVGASLVSSGGTTTIGFAALATSLFPVLSDLGLSLASGIATLFTSTVVVMPMVILAGERLKELLGGVDKKKVKKEKGDFKLYRWYGRIVSRFPLIFFLLSILITGLMFVGIQQINMTDVDFETLLPEDLEEMTAFVLIQNEFGDMSGVKIYLEIDPSDAGTDEPLDVRDPRVLEYVDILSKKAENVEEIVSVSSISKSARIMNKGILPKTLTESKELFREAEPGSRMSSDYSMTIISISASEDGISKRKEIVRQLNEVLDNTKKLEGVSVFVTGELAVIVEQDEFNTKDSTRTSLLALAGIVVFLFILSRSLKGVVLPLLTVIYGVIWTLGLVGFFKVPFNNITTSVITMTIGIGIDFGLQLMTRYQYELKSFDKRKAMENTITNILNPMVITVIAAVVGFRAMAFGNLKLMNDLGVTMSIAIVASMLASIIGVASFMLLIMGKKKLKK